jgi:hypothetical protein
MPRKKDAPLDASNRRISVIVQNLETKGDAPEKAHEKTGEKASEKHEAAAPGQSSPGRD